MIRPLRRECEKRPKGTRLISLTASGNVCYESRKCLENTGSGGRTRCVDVLCFATLNSGITGVALSPACLFHDQRDSSRLFRGSVTALIVRGVVLLLSWKSKLVKELESVG